jgi:hypothetical protein
MTTQPPKRSFAVVMGYLTGFVALVGASFCFFRGDLTSMALFLVAAALAFGLLANASLRQ